MICTKCGSQETVEVEQVFRNKTVHIALKCAECKRHIQYVQSVADEDFRIKFGEHNGKLLLDIPESYVEWMFENNVVNEGVKQRFRRLYAKRTALEKEAFKLDKGYQDALQLDGD